MESGIYSDGTLEVRILAPEGCTIAYTTDGSVPQADRTTGESTLTLTPDRSMSGTLTAYAEEMTYPGEPLIQDNEVLPYGVVLQVAAVD
ncbi:MAG: chitobiase/beta-hexosaminidase C-terminal domain-containing protein, partial [Solobacterium sp.]|nr:chitobiase/beta-hexosaminidase C-terminal domain-containing protein [Solobacterium sp.]